MSDLEYWIESHGLDVNIVILFISYVLTGHLLLSNYFELISVEYLFYMILLIVVLIIGLAGYKYYKSKRESDNLAITTLLFFVLFTFSAFQWSNTYYEGFSSITMSISLISGNVFVYIFIYYITVREGSASFIELNFLTGLLFDVVGLIMNFPLTVISVLTYSVPYIIFLLIIIKVADLVDEERRTLVVLITILMLIMIFLMVILSSYICSDNFYC